MKIIRGHLLGNMLLKKYLWLEMAVTPITGSRRMEAMLWILDIEQGTFS